MKTLLRFLNEASQSQAAVQARKMGLKSDRHGSWIDSSGNIVAKTEAGKLHIYDRKKKAQDEPTGRRGKAQDDPTGSRGKAADETGPRKHAPFLNKPDPAAMAAALQQQGQETEPAKGEGGGAEEGSVITVAFGRFNPPTAGHEKLLQAAKKAATGGDLKIYPSRSEDNKKNPLGADTKIKFMKKMFPDFEENIIDSPDMKSIFDVLVAADEEGYANVNIVVGADRQAEFENLAQKYNGDLYNFDLIRVISAGVRDADAEGIEGISASKMRKAVVDDDMESFTKGLPKGIDEKDVAALFKSVAHGLTKGSKKKTNEMWEVAPKFDWLNLRENYITKKIFNIGDMVESLNTGIVGRIIRRGANYLICVTEDNVMFKSWIKDMSEAYTEKRMKRMERLPGKPNTLVGTTGFRKYAQTMVHGQEKIDNMNIKEFINKYRKRD